MGSREKFLSIMIKELDLGYDLNSLGDYDGRKFFQKATYLIQEAINAMNTSPVPLDYHYNLYLHGPYSPELAESGYFILNNLDEFQVYQRSHKLQEMHQNRIDETSEFIKKALKALNLDPIKTLELLATVHFLYSKSYRYIDSEEKKREKVINKCVGLKPQFRSEECETALSLMFGKNRA